jgi:hypothetical protein
MLNGTAVAVALPFLDCFLNENGTALASGAPLPVRFGTWFWGLGHNPGRGIAPTAGPIQFLEECQPIDRLKQHINYFSSYNTPLDGRVSTVHFTGWVAARTGTVPIRGGDIPDPTLDVLVADHIASGTRFRSIDISCTGNPQDSYTMRSAGSRNAGEVSPVALYNRLFGSGFADPNSAEFKPDPRIALRKSVLSAVSEESRAFAKGVGAADRARMDEYFTSIRQMEQQLALSLEKPAKLDSCVRPAPPADGPIGVELEKVQQNHKLMSNLLVLALACNQTRIFNVLWSQSLSEVRRAGEAHTHHMLTHQEPVDPKLGYQVQVAWYNLRSMDAFAEFLDAFLRVKEGAGTLLDNTLIFANSDTNNAKVHAVDGVPIMLAGRAGGRIKTGLHVPGKGDPVSRVGLTALQIMGLPVDKWGTGSLETSKPISEILA